MSEAGTRRRLYRTRRWYRWTLRLLALGASLVSTLLLAETTRGGAAGLPGCGGDGGGVGGCSMVLASRWSTWLGVPVALGGIVSYLGLFGAALYVGPGRPAKVQRRAWRVMAFLVVTCALSGLWFVAVQGLFVGAWCVYCTAVHATGVLLLGLVFASGHVGRTRGGLYAAAGALPVVVLVLGQLLGPGAEEPESRIAHRGQVEVASGSPGRSLPAAGVVADSGPGGDRELTLAIGSSGVRLSPHEMPVYGSADAERLMVYVFDYGCGFCKAVHPTLEAAMDRYNGAERARLGIVLVAAPWDDVCGNAERGSLGGVRDACVAATLLHGAAAVSPATVERVHRTLIFENLSDGVSRVRAGLPLTPEVIDAAREQRRRNARLRRMLGGVTPQLIVGEAVVRGRPGSEAAVFELIELQLGLVPVERGAEAAPSGTGEDGSPPSVGR